MSSLIRQFSFSFESWDSLAFVLSFNKLSVFDVLQDCAMRCRLYSNTNFLCKTRCFCLTCCKSAVEFSSNHSIKYGKSNKLALLVSRHVYEGKPGLISKQQSIPSGTSFVIIGSKFVTYFPPIRTRHRFCFASTLLFPFCRQIHTNFLSRTQKKRSRSRQGIRFKHFPRERKRESLKHRESTERETFLSAASITSSSTQRENRIRVDKF